MSAQAKPEFNREKFAKLCEMMTSDHDAEALTALRMASRMLKGSGLTWSEIVLAEPVEREPDWSDEPSAAVTAEMRRWAVFANSYPRHAKWMLENAATFEFAASLKAGVMQWGRLTPRQQAAVEKCMRRDPAYG
jgi:hypothetical protein